MNDFASVQVLIKQSNTHWPKPGARLRYDGGARRTAAATPGETLRVVTQHSRRLPNPPAQPIPRRPPPGAGQTCKTKQHRWPSWGPAEMLRVKRAFSRRGRHSAASGGLGGRYRLMPHQPIASSQAAVSRRKSLTADQSRPLGGRTRTPMMREVRGVREVRGIGQQTAGERASSWSDSGV